MRKMLTACALVATSVTAMPASAQFNGTSASSQVNVNGDRFYVDSRGRLRDPRGRIVNNVRAERNGWFRDRRGRWHMADPQFTQQRYYRDRNGVLRDLNGNPVDERYAANAPAGQVWYGDDGRTYCRRSDGTVGTVVGGVAGALLGNAIGGTLGAVIGGAGGALGGREIQRSQSDCR